MKRVFVLLGVIALCGSVAAPTAAIDRGWHLRVFAVGFDPDLNELVPADDGEEIRVTADSDLGIGASLEYRFKDRLGVEFGLSKASPEIVLRADVPGFGSLSLRDSMSVLIFSADLNVHLTPYRRNLDVYVGVGIANSAFGDVLFVEPNGDSLNIAVSDDLSYSLKLGLEVGLGKSEKWAVTGNLRYLGPDIDVRQRGAGPSVTESFDFDTLSLSVGLAYGF